ncbi:MAG: hypothetical protein VST68_08140 [Nitrospirota bacterium]|nr:hypothetical protein [Nitrospirota bacterium]
MALNPTIWRGLFERSEFRSHLIQRRGEGTPKGHIREKRVLGPSKIVQKDPFSKAAGSEEAEAYVSALRVACNENAAGGLFQRISFAETKGLPLPGRNPALI